MRFAFAALAAVTLTACHPAPPADAGTDNAARLPTGQRLDPAGALTTVGQMPLAMIPAPDGRHLVLLMDGYRDEGVQVVDRRGAVTQTIAQEAAFIGLAFSRDGHTLFASGGNQDVVYRYRWEADTAALADSIVFAVKQPRSSGTRYPAGLAPSPGGGQLYVAENLADSLAVVDLTTGRIVQRIATGRYPYGVVVAPDGTVYVSNWGASTVSVFRVEADGHLSSGPWIAAGRHPSAMLLNASGTRLFVASGSTDRVSVVDTRAGRVIAELTDPPPGGVKEGATPNALALSDDGTRLFAAEADANAIAVFDLSPLSAGVPTAMGDDRLAGRVPTGWFPTSVLALGDTLVVANGKGAGSGPNPRGPRPGVARARTGAAAQDQVRQYTLGQLDGSLGIAPLARTFGADLAALTARVARANGWDVSVSSRRHYPPFTHVIYVIKENRTYDQVFGDLPRADGDSSLVFFGRAVTPNHHALAERFGIFDRFFVNAEVSADGHNWTDAAYSTDYTQKTTPINYSGRGRTFDYAGHNREVVPDDDVAEPAQGYLWDLARRAGITLRDYGEFIESGGDVPERERNVAPKAFLRANQDTAFAGWDLHTTDMHRMDAWLDEFGQHVAAGQMPALEIMALPNDHTAGAQAGMPSPKAMVADNDLALGRMIEALSKSPFWRSTVVFVVEDDAQNGPDHVDSHRSPALVISAWNRAGLIHRFTNTTDVLCTIEEILGLDRMSQFDAYGRPLRGIWSDTPNLAPYAALTPAQRLDEMNPPRTRSAIESRGLDLARADAGDMELMNRVLWHSLKGELPYPGATRMSALEARRSR
jgi:YVTN family beta-propeller protein